MLCTVCSITLNYDLYLYYNGEVKSIICIHKTKKGKKCPTTPVYKYGIQVPQNVAQVK